VTPGTATLDDVQRRGLLDIAEAAPRIALAERRRWVPEETDAGAALWTPGASFVTLLDVDERLLGCIGALEPRHPLAVDVAQHAVAAAFEDPRMPALTADEFERMTIEVSILSPLEEISPSSLDELAAMLEPGVDGVLVESGAQRATFLPAVWSKVASTDEFLGHLWTKAHLAPGAWPPGLRAWRYTTDCFDAEGPRAPI
jgi:AmmeMemoRadiSam system protein A